MPIVQVPYGNANLLGQSDYQRINNLLATNFMQVNKAHWEDGAGNISQGAVFQVGGTIYYCNAATAIGGVASNYIKLTPGGASPNMTLTPSYVANLGGVSWNSAYNGYYDVGGNLYIFDEIIALQQAEISAVNTRLFKAFSQLINNNYRIEPTIWVDNNVTENDVFDQLNTRIPNVGDIGALNGFSSRENGVVGSGTSQTPESYKYWYSAMERTAVNKIKLYFGLHSQTWLATAGVPGTYTDYVLTDETIQVNETEITNGDASAWADDILLTY